MHKPMIIAHRGASALAPENTKASITLAWELQAPAAECDIHLTRDKQIILMHDPTTTRTAGVDINISEANYAELARLDVGLFKDEKYAGEKIPLLSEIIETVPPGKKLLVEIKCGTEVLPYLEKIIDKSGKRNQITIIGFNLNVMAEAKKLMPDIPVYWLVMTEKDETGKWISHSTDLIKMAKERNLQGLDLHWAGLSKELVKKAHQAGLKVYTWTVDDLSIARQAKEMGVDGITTNKPDYLMKNL